MMPNQVAAIVFLLFAVILAYLSLSRAIRIPVLSALAKVASIVSALIAVYSLFAVQPRPYPTSAEPTKHSATPTQTEAPAATCEFSSDCIAAGLWFPFPRADFSTRDDGCWAIPDSWGISAECDMLTVHPTVNTQANIDHAIYRVLKGPSTIRFKFLIQLMTMQGSRISNVSLGVVPTNPEQPLQQGLFYQLEREDFPILLKHRVYSGQPDDLSSYLKDTNGKPLEYAPGTEQELLFDISNVEMNVFIEGQRVLGPIAIPSKERAFWVGYHVDKAGELSFILRDLKVTSH